MDIRNTQRVLPLPPREVLLVERAPGYLPLTMYNPQKFYDQRVVLWPHPWLYIATFAGTGEYHEDFAICRVRPRRLTPQDDQLYYPFIPQSWLGTVCVRHDRKHWTAAEKLHYMLMSGFSTVIVQENVPYLPQQLRLDGGRRPHFAVWNKVIDDDCLEDFLQHTPQELCGWDWVPTGDDVPVWFGNFVTAPTMTTFHGFRNWCREQYGEGALRFEFSREAAQGKVDE